MVSIPESPKTHAPQMPLWDMSPTELEAEILDHLITAGVYLSELISRHDSRYIPEYLNFSSSAINHVVLLFEEEK